VVLEIGGEVGALVLRTPPALNGREIDLSPEDESLPHTHSAVRERRLAQGVSYAAVYPSLRAGHYHIEASNQSVTIVGGQVTELDVDVERVASAHSYHEHHIHH
jgi:hypothetical protein